MCLFPPAPATPTRRQHQRPCVGVMRRARARRTRHAEPRTCARRAYRRALLAPPLTSLDPLTPSANPVSCGCATPPCAAASLPPSLPGPTRGPAVPGASPTPRAAALRPLAVPANEPPSPVGAPARHALVSAAPPFRHLLCSPLFPIAQHVLPSRADGPRSPPPKMPPHTSLSTRRRPLRSNAAGRRARGDPPAPLPRRCPRTAHAQAPQPAARPASSARRGVSNVRLIISGRLARPAQVAAARPPRNWRGLLAACAPALTRPSSEPAPPRDPLSPGTVGRCACWRPVGHQSTAVWLGLPCNISRHCARGGLRRSGGQGRESPVAVALWARGDCAAGSGGGVQCCAVAASSCRQQLFAPGPLHSATRRL